MSPRRHAPPRRETALREASVGEARRPPRELYDAGPPPATGSLVDAAIAPDSQGADAPFRGEFEQRAPGPQGQGQPGQFASDQALREQLCQRIADDARLRDTTLEVIVDEQVLTLSGEVPDAAIRDLVLGHAHGLGLSEVRDSLRVAPTPAARAAPPILEQPLDTVDGPLQQ